MTYVDELRRREEIRAAQPKREYISNEEYGKLKSALTRAENSGDPAKVLKAVEKAVAVFDQNIWPDDWSRWRRALEDAAWSARQEAIAAGGEEYERLVGLYYELSAASQVLFS